MFPLLTLFNLYIDELETYLDKIDGILHAYLTQWLHYKEMVVEMTTS
jgi:hypothetical protein